MSTHTEPHLLTELAYLPGGGIDAVCALLARHGVGFEPVLVRVSVMGDDDRELPFRDDVWDEVAAVPDRTAVHLETEPAGPAAEVEAGLTATTVRVSGVPVGEALLDDLLHLPGLLGGASGDETDARWQGETDPQMYQMFYDGPWEHLPRTVDEWDDEVIDVSGNPGRIDDGPGMRLWAAQDLWFGPASAAVIAYDAVPTLPVGEVTHLGGGLWHVRLWADGTDLDDVRKAQQALRDHLGYDDAVRRADEVREALTAGRPDDPMFVAQEGSFPHGGTTRFLQYFSATGHPTTRSRAASLNIKEFDADNREVHDEYVDLTTSPHPDLD